MKVGMYIIAYVNTCIHTHIRTHTYMCVCVRVFLCMGECMHVHNYIHTFIDTYTFHLLYIRHHVLLLLFDIFSKLPLYLTCTLLQVHAHVTGTFSAPPLTD